MRCLLKTKAKAALMLAVMLVAASIIPMSPTVHAEVQTFDDGFATSTTLEDLKAKGWNFPADESGMSFEDGVLTAKVRENGAENKADRFSFDLGEELTGEFYVEVDYSLGGTSAYGNQFFISLSNSTSIGDIYAKTYGNGLTLFMQHQETTAPWRKFCICGGGGTAIQTHYNNFTIYTSEFGAHYSGPAENNFIRLKKDKLTMRYYINTDEGYFTTQLKTYGNATFNYPIQHAHADGTTSLVKMPINKKSDDSNRGFSTLIFETPMKRNINGAWVVPGDTDAYIKIYGVRIEKFRTATASAKLSTGDTIVNGSIIAKPDKVDLTFTSPITSGNEAIELYENNTKVAVPACEWNADQTVLTYAGSNFKNSSAYKIVVPGSKMSSNGYTAADAEINFLTEHNVLPITKNSVIITDESQNPIDESALTGLTGGDGKALNVTVNASNTGTAKQKLTLIVALYSDNDGFVVTERVSRDVAEIEAGQAKDLTAQINLPASGTFDAKIYLWDSLSGMVPLNTYTAPQV